MTHQYLLCRSCGVLLPMDTDSSVQAASLRDEEAQGDEDSDEFMAAHQQHGLERVARLTTTAVYDRAVWDPMGTMWFEVASGMQTFVVRASRASIDSPRRYDVVPGSIQSGRSAVEIDEPYLRSALDRHFFPHLLRPTRIDHFVSMLRSLLHEVSAEDIETSFDDADDPAVGIAPFPDDLCRQVLARCTEVFDEWEAERVVSFVDINRFEDGALALRVRQQPAVLAA